MHSSKKDAALQSPLLSIVVPVLNEAATVGALAATLARQEGVDFEVIVVDGGSSDNTLAVLQDLAPDLPCPCRILSSPRGRAVQMNTGAAVVRGEWLLFLHADSHFPAADALASALDALSAAQVSRGDRKVAGRFALVFGSAQGDGVEPDRLTSRSGGRLCNPKVLAFHEAKARLNRPGCIHGDQGFLLHRDFFAEVGPFDPVLPFLEDDRLAEKIFAAGEWLLLPAQIVTSLRRFAVEGVRERRKLNAIMLTLHATGCDDLLRQPELYRQQGEAARLELTPILCRIDHHLSHMSPGDRRRWWQAIGEYLWGSRWQVALWLQIHLKMGEAGVHLPIESPGRRPNLFDRGGIFLATVLVRGWWNVQKIARQGGEKLTRSG